MAELTYLQAISDGLRTEMRRDKRVFLIGEDVGVYGGAFKVSLGFQEEFGPWRVIDAPLAEAAIVGSCTRSEEHTSELQSLAYLVCRLLLEKKKFLLGRAYLLRHDLA